MKTSQSRLARVWSVLPPPNVADSASEYVHEQQKPCESLHQGGGDPEVCENAARLRPSTEQVSPGLLNEVWSLAQLRDSSAPVQRVINCSLEVGC